MSDLLMFIASILFIFYLLNILGETSSDEREQDKNIILILPQKRDIGEKIGKEAISIPLTLESLDSISQKKMIVAEEYEGKLELEEEIYEKRRILQ